MMNNSSYPIGNIKQELSPIPHLPQSQQVMHHPNSYVPPVRYLAGSHPNGPQVNATAHAHQPQSGLGPPQRPTSADANTIIVQFLMNYVVGSDREFSKKAIESLIKKLKDKRNELDDFILTVSSMGQVRTKCITTPRTLDGRLQVAGRKGFPHVVYAKIFRWPDLHKNELKHKNLCICAFDLKVEQVCVNPYHYERVLSVEGTELESHGSASPLESIGSSSDYQPNIPTPGAAFLPKPVAAGPPVHPRGPGRPPKQPSAQQAQYVPQQQHKVSPQQQQRLPPQVQAVQGALTPQQQISPIHTYQQMKQEIPNQQISPQQQQQYAPQQIQQMYEPAVQQNTPNPFADFGAMVAANFGAGSSNALLQPQQDYGQQAASYTSTESIPPFLLGEVPPPVASKYINGVNEFSKPYTRPFISDKPMPLHWCAISYYEYSRKVGETFQGAADIPQIFVDAGLDSTGWGRFCLGSLTNTERTDMAEKCRRNIARGIRLDLKGEGDVWLTVLSPGPVFVESAYLDALTEREEPGHAHKFVQYITVKIFDLQKCHESWRRSNLERVMARRMNRESRARRVRLDNHQVAGSSSGGTVSLVQQSANGTALGRIGGGDEDSDGEEASTDAFGVDDFRSLCTLRISFFKGFGLSYPRRTIQETPCWIELHLHRALQLLDEVMNTPPDDVLNTLH